MSIAAGGLLASLPILAAASVAIAIDSPGPILFRQERVGRGRARIETLKLRTMIAGADRAGPAVTAGGDRRITRVGRWLRKAKLDELPQLWNVLRGEMSLVGPRPEVPHYVALYRPEWASLLDVRPGLTDIASMVFRDEESLLASASDRDQAYREVIMPMKLALAVEGVQRASLAYDLGVLVRTVNALIGRRDPLREAILEEARRRIAALNDSNLS